MKSPWPVLLVLACLLLGACRDSDVHGTTERVRRSGRLRVGLVANPAGQYQAELAGATRLALRLGARACPYSAPLPDLAKALAAGVIDLILVEPPLSGPLARGDDPEPELALFEATLEGRPVLLLLGPQERRFQALVRELAGQPTGQPTDMEEAPARGGSPPER